MRTVSGTRHDEAAGLPGRPRLSGRLGRSAALALTATVLLCGTGCEEDESKPHRTTLPSIFTWAREFAVAASGQGVSEAAAYAKGNGTKVVPLMLATDPPPARWNYNPITGMPATWTPSAKSQVQLVVFIQDTETKTKWTYTNGGRFYHHVWTIELREALTGRLVARKTLAGDNDPPHVTTTTHPTDEHSIYPLFVAWLGGFVQ